MDHEPPESRLQTPPRPHCRWRLPVLAGLLSLHLGLAATSGAAELTAVTAPPPARILADMEPALARHLAHSFDLAQRTVAGREACRTLFRGLDRPATLALSDTFYVQASGVQERRICRRGVSAFTAVGSRVTYLCRDFRRLAPPRAAAALVHEALHRAGLEESPSRGDAPSSAEINQRVAAACRL